MFAVAASLFFVPQSGPPQNDAAELIQPVEHIVYQRGVASVSLSGRWLTFSEDVRILKELPDLQRIVVDVMFAPPGTERSVRDNNLGPLQDAFPGCEIVIWTGEF